MTDLPAWLPPQRPWYKRHQLAVVVGALFIVGTIITYWYVMIPLAVVIGVVAVVLGRRQYRRERDRALAARADAAAR